MGDEDFLQEAKEIHALCRQQYGVPFIAANLAKGFDLPTSIRRAKDYLSGALEAMLDLGKGRGPMMHNFNLTGEYAKAAKKWSISER